ncbi:MAG: hypothetical protein OFPII_09370 [Osedax symbiont Rs1]|nr:MAG: hypothetical protein OFPII_09370 [Osedax symbiont Rs1]
MKDYRKGILILLLGALVTILALAVDDRRWEMAYINFGTETEQQVADLQAQILSGIDPTLNADATAAGAVKRVAIPTCYRGKIARNLQTELFHDQPYTSIKNLNQTYIEVASANQLTFLVKGAFETQSASILKALPERIEQKLELVSGTSQCIQLDMYLAKIKE